MGSSISYSVNEALQGPAFAYMSIAIVGIFFGSNYVITKKVPTGDGMSFQWFMCLGILFWAFFMMFLGGFSPNVSCYDAVTFKWGGVLGGFLWGLGNVMVPTIIDCIGLGLGMLVWGITNFLVGWIIGLAGLGSLEPPPAPGTINLPMNISGGVIGVLSMVTFAFIKPVVTKLETSKDGHVGAINDGESEWNERDTLTYSRSTEKHSPRQKFGSMGSSPLLEPQRLDSLLSREIPTDDDHEHYRILSDDSDTYHTDGGRGKHDHHQAGHPASERMFGLPKQWVGLGMAVLAGSLYGFYLIPFSIWTSNHQGSRHGPLEYVFSLCLGIFRSSSLSYLIYVIYKKNHPQVFGEAILPAIVCGMMWAIATVSWMFMNSYFSLAVGYPVGAIVPNLVSSMWSVFYFKEIRGRRNLFFLAFGLLLNIVCVALIVLSKSN